MEIINIDHIVLRTANPAAMQAFYCDVLGCKLERSTSKNLGLTQLRAGDSLIDLVSVDSELGRRGGPAPSRSANNLDHFCLRLKSISPQEIRDYLVSHDIPVGEFAERYGAQGAGPSLYIEDPDGNIVELRSQR